jgi:hypothetical protein
MTIEVETLRCIRTFAQLARFLRDELDWPIEADEIDDLTFEYAAEELGLDTKHAAKIKEIKQLRPLDSKQPWGIFWVSFEKKRLPMVVLRRLLGNLIIKTRARSRKADRPSWHLHDLLFISSYGEEEHRNISFAHFTEDPETDELPVLRILGWDDQNSIMHLDRVANRLQSHFRWPDDPADVEDWRNRWSEAFTDRYREAIQSADELIVRLAALAGNIRKRVREVLDAETERGPMRRLFQAVQKILIHDMYEDDFADMYAQTVAYGLLSARFSRPAGLTAQNLVQLTAISNPFLENLMENLFRLNRGKFHFDVDEVGINDVLELLRNTNIEAIKAAFSDKNPAEDPVIRFYEGFLKQYDPKQRIKRGIFFTPRPVVSYIVRSVHELLQTEFGLEDGLASAVTWGEMLKCMPELKLPVIKAKDPHNPESKDILLSPDEAFVQILDPATGTGTFLFESIEVIERTMKEKWLRETGRKSWNDPEIASRWQQYVPQHLLPRLYGYELMMAPYAIAHLKLALKLGETGYQFQTGDRLRVYITNSLEPPSPLADPRLADMFTALATEAQEVNEIKANKRYTVVIGNPPYSNFGQLNRIPFILDLLADYKWGLKEKKINLDDDFIKFVRFSQYYLDKTGVGVHGMITNNVFMDGITHRRIRESLMTSFSALRILDLHGSAKKLEQAPDGSKDENVFDIQQGVGISVFWKRTRTAAKEVMRSDMWGSREAKYAKLSNNSISLTMWTELHPSPPYFFFVEEHQGNERKEYELWWSTKEIFQVNNDGIQTKRDNLTIQFTRAELIAAVNDLKRLSPEDLRAKYNLPEDGRDWTIDWARKDVERSQGFVIPVIYRPFDKRFTFYTGKSKGFLAYPRAIISAHLVTGKTVALALNRFIKLDNVTHFFAVKSPVDTHLLETANSCLNVCPLYLITEENKKLLLGRDKRPNLSANLIKAVAARLRLQQKGTHGLPEGVTAEDLFQYAYAVFHSPGYRTRYAEFLKIDFPRLPLPGSPELFKDLARVGGDLVALHLMESRRLDQPITRFLGEGDAPVAKGYPKYAEGTVWINPEQGCKGVPEEVWNFHIGGYQVCDKWLKDRRGRILSKEDIDHYQKIVVALNETICLMAEIDKVIDAHGGWPAAFEPRKKDAENEKRQAPNVSEIPSAKDSGDDYAASAFEFRKAAERGTPFRGDPESVKGSSEDTIAQAPPSEDDQRKSEYAFEDLLVLVRRFVTQAGVEGISGNELIRAVALELGYQRAGRRVSEEISSAINAASHRGISYVREEVVYPDCRQIDDYPRPLLKDLFLSAIGGSWIDREEAMRVVARYLGFARTGGKIQDQFKSIISGLLREGRLESQADGLIRKV